jgi:hypothetical protein
VYTHHCQERDILFAKGRTVNSQSDVILVAGSARLESRKEGRVKRDSTSVNLTSAFRSRHTRSTPYRSFETTYSVTPHLVVKVKRRISTPRMVGLSSC